MFIFIPCHISLSPSPLLWMITTMNDWVALLCCPGTFLWHCYRQPTSKGNSLVCHIIIIISHCSCLVLCSWHREMTKTNIFAISKCRFLPQAFQIPCDPLPLRWWLNPAKMLWLYVWIRFPGKANSKRLIQQNKITSPSSTHDAHSNLTAHLPKYLKPLHIQQVQCDGNWKLCEPSTSMI